MARLTAAEVIKILKLEPLPYEGGFFRQTFRSPEGRRQECLPPRFWLLTEGRVFRPDCTAIYYLITPENFSAMHLLKGTEVWHFYAGDPVEMLQLVDYDDPEVRQRYRAKSQVYTIGTDLANNMQPQVVVPPFVWQGTRLVPGGEWALLGTTMTPGYHDDDFELGDRVTLLARFPDFADHIITFTE